MAYSINPSQDNCYEGTTCLINKLDIRDEERLSLIEAQITFAKALMLEEYPIEGDFGFEHLKKIHEFLLSDLYEWAGKPRTVDIAKKRTRFLPYRQIEDFANSCLDRVKQGYLDNLKHEEFVYRIAELYNELNYIHPFREGNGRAQRIYFAQLIRKYGYDINFSDVDTDEFLIATIKAAQGVIDYLVDFFREAIILLK